VTIAVGDDAFGVGDHLVGGLPVRVGVDGGRLAALAAQDLEERQAGPLAQDVPQRLVDAGERVADDGAVAPVAVHAPELPDVFDARDVAPDHQRLEMAIEQRLHRKGALGERRAPEARETRFELSIFTITRRCPAGWVTNVRTSRMVIGRGIGAVRRYHARNANFTEPLPRIRRRPEAPRLSR